MPWSVSALVAASGFTVDTLLGLMTTYFLWRSTGRIWSSMASSASCAFLRRLSPLIRETADAPAALGGAALDWDLASRPCASSAPEPPRNNRREKSVGKESPSVLK